MTNEERENLSKLIDQMAAELFEHCACVVIVCSIDDEQDGQRATDLLARARGNHHTRMGLCFDYLLGQAFAKHRLPEDS